MSCARYSTSGMDNARINPHPVCESRIGTQTGQRSQIRPPGMQSFCSNSGCDCGPPTQAAQRPSCGEGRR